MLEQIRCRDQELDINNRRMETAEAEKTQLMREIETINDKIEKLERNKNDKIKYEESYVAELQTKLDASRESELLSLGRLARMSGGRKMLISDIPRPDGRNVQFRVVVHMIISISRMKFLVRRWKKTKKTARKAWSHERPLTRSTEERDQPGLSFV